MKERVKKLNFLKPAIIIGIGLFCFSGLFSISNIYASGNNPASGTISANRTTVGPGESVIITVNGEDADGLVSLELFYKGRWHIQRVSGISNSVTWAITENGPGVYRYCGKVESRSANFLPDGYRISYSNLEYTNTVPNCIDVEVSISFYPSPSCADECSYNGQTRCNGGYKQTCGDYDSDSCLEWSSLRSCSGNTSCGYGRCDSGERPNWYCSGGSCLYNCQYSSSCVSSPRQCSEGPCCDGDNYRPSTWICDFDIQTQYGCPWGTVGGADVGKRTRTRLQYCSGSSAECTGTLGSWLPWTSWKIADNCGTNEVCSAGSPYCYSSPSTEEPASNAYPVQTEENNNLIISVLEKREGSSSKWEKEIMVAPGESIDFLVIVANKGEEGLKDVILKTDFPQEVIYKDNFKINGDSLEGDIKNGLSIGSFSPGIIKTIVFQGEISSEVGIEEKDINVQAIAGDLSASDSVKISFGEFQKQKAAIGLTLKSFLGKWYNWILAILGVIVLFYFIKGIFNWFKK